MKDQLKNYIDLLFAGASDAEDIKQEILQNTLDRYDDLVSQGKTPEAAYRLAISGIGDINEILGNPEAAVASSTAAPKPTETKEDKSKRAIAIAMYIACPIPLIILAEFGFATLGLCMLLILVAGATALLISCGKDEKEETDEDTALHNLPPEARLRGSINKIIRTSALILFFVISFITGAWLITWLVFPISASIQGLVNAIFDLKEAK